MSVPDRCYIYSAGNVTRTDDLLPCGVANSTNPQVPCCWKGDICLSNGICEIKNSLNGGGGYVSAGCTDQNFGGQCRTLCKDNQFGDITYVKESESWYCCSYPPDGGRDCEHPTSEKFLAPPPTELITIQSLPLSGTPTYVTGLPSTTTSPPSTTAPSSSAATSSSSSSGLSNGASAGIGVGATIGGLALFGVVGYFIYRRRRRRRNEFNGVGTFKPHAPEMFPHYHAPAPIGELPVRPKPPAELATTEAA